MTQMFSVPIVGKIYGCRFVIAVYVGENLLGNDSIMVDYRYDTEPEDVKPMTCSLSTFKSQTKVKNWNDYKN
jgi:hypothetical protein